MIVAYVILVILSILSIVGWLIYLHFEKKVITPTLVVEKPMHITSEKITMSNVVVKKHHKYVSENQQQAWFRKTFLKPRRKK